MEQKGILVSQLLSTFNNKAVLIQFRGLCPAKKFV